MFDYQHVRVFAQTRGRTWHGITLEVSSDDLVGNLAPQPRVGARWHAQVRVDVQVHVEYQLAVDRPYVPRDEWVGHSSQQQLCVCVCVRVCARARVCVCVYVRVCTALARLIGTCASK
jgi:hypothetical protein